ncbi:16S rRNA (uracil(1498)-N(3))-methyltransferase [Novosphingobium mangrovi (ex Huang et al. 2023)]|uniref:Ribosomal RNA small subunit methyltransferase E n=1 Tax=Novosphingobium mangrovi (ex Huang et al. 2023) TaxID=2976432 RepID=A0ABT2I0C4_9SPHN|nr:16S rRNA (uracil(1498)-N(3))-methyltransferase [Novosphingobium mangrovi (ex Huang et al. 2023)]MCT2398252.1 16S rRNA (uracil(1498)-N(3))-methyltransferase [Novosphingobium mangrovi (ex Huang et al. 2023)]
MGATPAWPPRSAPRLFVPGPLAAGAAVAIEGGQAHYLAKVMRVAPGDAVVLCDDMTGEWAAAVVSAGKRDVVLELREQLRAREDVPDFWLCAALLKKPNFDLVLEKATELGVRRIQPMVTRRCVADKLNPERARTIVTEAAEQCARTALPELAPATRLDTLLRDWPQDRALFFADEQGGEPAAAAFAAHAGPAALLVGPEGGFDDGERAAIRAHPQARAITLGPRILRGETAGIAGCALWMATAGDWSLTGN